MKFSWLKVANALDEFARAPKWGDSVEPTEGQRRAVAAISARVKGGKRSLLLADEVGMGKTLIAAVLIRSVQKAGGRSAVVIPPGLGSQWQKELRRLNAADATLSPIRSYWTFIEAYQRPQDVDDRAYMKERRARALASKRQQREIPAGAWSDEPILLLSHTLGRTVWTDGTTQYYQALIDAIHRVADGVRRYRRNPSSGAHRNVARQAAECILDGLSEPEQQTLIKLLQPSDRDAALRHIMARGFGKFDLVVVDEAHKARGMDSSLSRVLGDLTWETPDVFRLGLTATPVELSTEQWIDTFKRIEVPDAALVEIQSVIKEYVEALDRLQNQKALTRESVEEFRTFAARFQAQLSPWVLRRDKREDMFLKAFCEKHIAHREVRPIIVSFADMRPEWKRMFIATEALSLLEEHTLTREERRQRLALPDGRHIKHTEEQTWVNTVDRVFDDEAKLSPGGSVQDVWIALLKQGAGAGIKLLYSHPAIETAVREIEAAVRSGEKALVFGRFTRPMRALTLLLDAREMVRRLNTDDGPDGRWPGSTLGSMTDERCAALAAALSDAEINPCKLDFHEVEQRLQERAAAYEASRRANMDAMRKELMSRAKGEPEARELLQLWESDGRDEALQASTAQLFAALEDQRGEGERGRSWAIDSLLAAYQALIREAAGASEDTDINKHADIRELLKQHLLDFGNREGNFARLMNGDTSPQTRRLLQSAFNREHSWPMVLVAQSSVGREGLDLHRACRTVFMLHLEWNPAHVEQQIGRVDRIESRWERLAKAYIQDPASLAEVPRIVVRPIVVEGTYDDHHWSVLKKRWDAMRAQLNGDVLPEAEYADGDTERKALIEEARAAAPSFSPSADPAC